MKKIYILVASITMLLLNGCAGKTTDPRQGGLFSYSPDAYEQRLVSRENHLVSIENDTTKQKKKSVRLKQNLTSEKKKLKQYK